MEREPITRRPHLVPQRAHALMLDPRREDAARPLLDRILTLPA